MSPCPSPETLSRLARDSSSGSHFATMEAHVQMCANCQKVLERLAADASVVRGTRPRTTRGAGAPPHDPRIRNRGRARAGRNGGRLSGVAAATGPPCRHQSRQRERS